MSTDEYNIFAYNIGVSMFLNDSTSYQIWFVDSVRAIKFCIDSKEKKVTHLNIDTNIYNDVNRESKRIKNCYGDIKEINKNLKPLIKICAKYIDFLNEKFNN